MAATTKPPTTNSLIMTAVINHLFPPKTKWTTDMIPDQSGRVILITGGNSGQPLISSRPSSLTFLIPYPISAGVGKECARVLLTKNARVYIAARSAQKAAEAIAELETQTGRTALFLQLDLASLKSVKAAAEEFSQREGRLDVLMNNGCGSLLLLLLLLLLRPLTPELTSV